MGNLGGFTRKATRNFLRQNGGKCGKKSFNTFCRRTRLKQIPVSVKRKKREECPSGLIPIDSNCDKAVGVTTESVAVRTVYEQLLLTKICRTRVKVFLQAMKERDLQKQKKVADVDVSLRDKLKGFVIRSKRQ